jgi:hypothetical protein
MIYNKVNETIWCVGDHVEQYLRVGSVATINDITDERFGTLGEIIEIRTYEDKPDKVVLNLLLPEDDEAAADITSAEIVVDVDIVEEY